MSQPSGLLFFEEHLGDAIRVSPMAAEYLGASMTKRFLYRRNKLPNPACMNLKACPIGFLDALNRFMQGACMCVMACGTRLARDQESF